MKNKTLSKIIAGIALGSSLLFPGKSEAQEISFYRDANFQISYLRPIVSKVNNIPQEIRTVTRENDYEKITSIIEDDDVKLYDRLSILKARTGIRASVLEDKFNFKIGAALGWEFDTAGTWGYYKDREDAGTKEDSVYSGSDTYAPKSIGFKGPIFKCETTPDGGGKSNENLVYYYVHPSYWYDWNTFFKPSLFSELEFKLDEESTLTLGCEIYQQSILARKGHNGSSDHVQDEIDMAKLTVARPYASWKYIDEDKHSKNHSTAYIGVEAGLNRVVSKEFSELGSEADFKFNDYAFDLAVKVGFEF